MFLEPDEHIIVMEDIKYPFSLDDLKRLEDAGIKTLYATASVNWDAVYKRGSTALDFSDIDARIEKYMGTNLKLLLPFYYLMPRWFPPDWYFNNSFPEPNRVIPNYGKKELGDAIDVFANEVIEYYKDIKYKVHFIFAIPSGGEFLFNTMQPTPPDEVIHKFIIDRQKILVKQHGEIWLHLHNFLGGDQNWNGPHLPALYQALKNEFKDTSFYSIQFAHFAVGNIPTSWECQMMIKDYNERYGVKFFVGSQYCEGLLKNLNDAVQQNAWGYVTSPLHRENFTQRTSIEPWMVDDLKETNKRFREAYDN